MELRVIDDNGRAAASVTASDDLFGREYNEALVHQVVTAFMANARQGTRAQKDRANVKHSTRKPWRQKGSGRARAGMSSSPLWRGGGKLFPSSPEENFTQKVNRKMYRAGVAAILSQLVREERLSVVDAIALDMPKTKILARKIKGMGFDQALIIVEDVDDNLWLSSRNLPNVLVLEPHQADPVSLLRYQNVLMTRGAVKRFEEIWA